MHKTQDVFSLLAAAKFRELDVDNSNFLEHGELTSVVSWVMAAVGNRLGTDTEEVKKRIMLGNFVLSSGYYDAYYNKAQQVRQLLVEKINSVFETCDLIIMPNSPTTAFALGEKNQDPIAMYLSDIYTVFANLTGIPAIALPLYKHSNGMPYGLQLLGKRNDEQLVLQFSKSLISAH